MKRILLLVMLIVSTSSLLAQQTNDLWLLDLSLQNSLRQNEGFLIRVITVLLVGFLMASYSNTVFSQNKLKFDFDDQGKTYIKFSIRTQTWARYSQMNPGTTINGELVDNFVDLSVRRLRISATAQLSEKLYFNSMWGWNNLNYISNRSVFVHALDLYSEYTFSPQLTVGAGKSAWQGPSRWHIRSTKSMMAVDAPLFPLATVNKIDDLGRNFGFWIKGKVSNFDYRVSSKLPTIFISSGVSPTTDFAQNIPHWQHSAYVKYEFFDKESNKSAYHTGTYLGSKKVLALGAGFLYQPEAMWNQANANSDVMYYDMKHWNVDAFLDMPLDKTSNTAITSYLGYLVTDFGPNFVRNLGANGVVNGTDPASVSYNGAGTAFPIAGTGSTTFFTLGYLLPKGFIVGDEQQLQPNIAIQYSQFDNLDDPTVVIDAGVNWVIKGHGNKFSLGYQNRPIYTQDASSITQSDRKGMVVLQYQLEIN